MFAYLAFLTLLMGLVGLGWPGRVPDLLRSFSDPALWATHHLAIIGAIGLLLVWLWIRDWSRSMAIVTAVLSTIALTALILAWNAFFHAALGASSDSFIPNVMLSVTCRLAACGMVLSAICSAWYAATLNRMAVWVFLGSPLLLLTALLTVASRTYVTRTFEVGLLPFYPSIWSLLVIIAAVGVCLWCICGISRRLHRRDFVEPACWVLGVMAHGAFYVCLCVATVAFMPLMRRLFDISADMRWRLRTVSSLIALEVLLVLAVGVTLYVRRNGTKAAERQ